MYLLNFVLFVLKLLFIRFFFFISVFHFIICYILNYLFIVSIHISIRV
jgi:hypothetical protein